MMSTTIAVFSDTHGNTPALRAVLREIDALKPRMIVNLGDLVSGSLDPRGTLEILLDRTDIITVRGNGDRRLGEDSATSSTSDRPAREELTESDRDWLSSLPVTLEVLPGVLAFHGTPAEDTTFLLETVTRDGIREATDEEVRERIGAERTEFRVYLCGHSHIQRFRRLPWGAIAVNPGSVGNQAYQGARPHRHIVESGSPHARFSLLSLEGEGWKVQHHAVDYDVEAAVAFAIASGKEAWKKSLRTGRL